MTFDPESLDFDEETSPSLFQRLRSLPRRAFRAFLALPPVARLVERLSALWDSPKLAPVREVYGPVYRAIRNALRILVVAMPTSDFKYPRLRATGIWTARAIGFVFFCFLAVDWNLLWLFGSSPSISRLEDPDMATASEVWSADSVLLGRFFLEDRSPAEWKEIPPHVVDALVSAEDARFFQHKGVDLVAPFSVAWSVVRGDKRGGSTITQQLAKNLFKIRRKRSQGLLGHIPGVRVVVIKTKEWLAAVKLEFLHSKEEILTLYLNTMSFGNNAYGIKVAATRYFSRDLPDLRVEEAAVLVGLLKATTTYDPVRNPKNSTRRRNIVLDQMAKYGKLTGRQADSLKELPLEVRFSVEKPSEGIAPYFRAAIASHLKDWCKQNGMNLYTDGLKIVTTIDSRWQKHAEAAVSEQVKELQGRFNRHWAGQDPWIGAGKTPIPGYLDSVARTSDRWKALARKHKTDTAAIARVMRTKVPMRVFSWKGERDTMMSPLDSIRYHLSLVHAGFVAIDPFTGGVRAWVGGIDHSHFQFDHVSQARRQAGSTFKPFAYTAALERGWAPCDRITDQPVTIRYEEDGEQKTWSPHNADWTYSYQNMTLRHALGRSINTVTAQLTEQIGPDAVRSCARRMGIESQLKAVPSIGLGPNTVTLLEMVAAYGAFLNGGKRSTVRLVDRIENSEGKVITALKPKSRRVLSEEIAWLMTFMLRGGIEEPGGTSQNLWSFDIFKGGNEFGGKTGTSSDHADGWFIGLAPSLVAGAWTGNEDPAVHFRSGELGEGSKTALPIVGRFLEKLVKDKEIAYKPGRFPKPPMKIKRQYICPTPWPKDTASDSTAVDSAVTAGETIETGATEAE